MHNAKGSGGLWIGLINMLMVLGTVMSAYLKLSAIDRFHRAFWTLLLPLAAVILTPVMMPHLAEAVFVSAMIGVPFFRIADAAYQPPLALRSSFFHIGDLTIGAVMLESGIAWLFWLACFGATGGWAAAISVTLVAPFAALLMLAIASGFALRRLIGPLGWLQPVALTTALIVLSHDAAQSPVAPITAHLKGAETAALWPCLVLSFALFILGFGRTAEARP